MTEPSSTPTYEAPPEAEKPNVVRMVLFAILAVMIVALIYEYGFVRRSYKAAEVAVDDFVDKRTDDAVTPEVVRTTLRKEPVGGLEDKGDYFLEHYQWTRWLPWKTYDIYVVYEHTDPPQFFNSTRPAPPGANETPSMIDTSYVEPGAPGPGVPGGAPAESPRNRRPAAEEDGQVVEGEAEGASATTPESGETPAAGEGERSPEGEPAGESTDEPKTAAAPAAESDAEEGKAPEPAPDPESPSSETSDGDAPAAKDDGQSKTSDENE